MAATEDVDRLNEQYRLASGEFLKGNPEPVKKLWSHKEDVSLANPYGPPVYGWYVWRWATFRWNQPLENREANALAIRRATGL